MFEQKTGIFSQAPNFVANDIHSAQNQILHWWLIVLAPRGIGGPSASKITEQHAVQLWAECVSGIFLQTKIERPTHNHAVYCSFLQLSWAKSKTNPASTRGQDQD